MTLGVQIVAGWMAFVITLALAMLAWAVYSGQLDDADALNRIPLEEQEPVAWPGRSRVRKEV